MTTLAQPIEDDDIRRPREIQLLIAQLARVAGLELRQLRSGNQPTNEQLRRAYGVAASFHIALVEQQSDAITLDTPTADIVDHLTAAGVDWHGGPIPEPGDQSRADSAHAACVVGTLSIWPDESQRCWMWRDGDTWGNLESYEALDRLVAEARSEDLFLVDEHGRHDRATSDDRRRAAASKLGLFRRDGSDEVFSLARYRIFRLDGQADLRAPTDDDLKRSEKRTFTEHGTGFEDADGVWVFIARVGADGLPRIGF